MLYKEIFHRSALQPATHLLCMPAPSSFQPSSRFYPARQLFSISVSSPCPPCFTSPGGQQPLSRDGPQGGVVAGLSCLRYLWALYKPG